MLRRSLCRKAQLRPNPDGLEPLGTQNHRRFDQSDAAVTGASQVLRGAPVERRSRAAGRDQSQRSVCAARHDSDVGARLHGDGSQPPILKAIRTHQCELVWCSCRAGKKCERPTIAPSHVLPPIFCSNRARREASVVQVRCHHVRFLDVGCVGGERRRLLPAR